MDLQDIRTLKLLEIIHDARMPPSQRDLAQTLGVSLGWVNSFLKRLVKKGYFKISHLPKNRMGYILTPTGVAEKSRLTYHYIQHSYRFYQDTRRRFKAVFQKLAAVRMRRVAFFGAGELAEIGLLSIQETGLQFCGVSDDSKDGQHFFGQPILSIAELAQRRVDKVLITTGGNPASAAENLAVGGVSPGKIQFL